MLLFKYTTGSGKKLKKVESLYSADPKFYIHMPDGEEAPVFDYKAFPFEIFVDAPKISKKGKTVDHVQYYNLANSFDIETTTILNNGEPYAFMYQWQYCLEDYVFMGKTWQEFQEFTQILSSTLDLGVFIDDGIMEGVSLVTYIFNMEFEFQFARWFMGELVNPLITDKYKPLLIPTKAGITYRCAYRLTNKNLNSFTKGFPHHKLKGDLDYTKIRVPIASDPKNGLTDLELAYCYNDVKGLSEAIRDRLEKDKYNIASIPLTSTGYVRKDCQKSMNTSPLNRRRLIETQLSAPLYKLCRFAFRGGNTHTNARFSNVLVGLPELGGIGGEIHHGDIASSYPTEILTNDGFPLGPFIPVDPAKVLPNFETLTKKYCLLVRFQLWDPKYIGSCGVPYMAKSKTITRIADKDEIVEDNGRIFSAPFVEVCCTEIDMKYILRDYSYSRIEVVEVYKSHKGKLPYELRAVCLEYYKKKTLLKHSTDPEEAYEYARSKEQLNSTYGMMVMRLDRIEYQYVNNEYKVIHKPLQEMLNKFYESKSSFLPYQYGLWVTAMSREALQRGLDITGPDTLYCDTDSVFFIGDHKAEFEELNKKLIDKAIKAGAVATTKSGEVMPIGVWDFEPDAVLFKSLGAKKYLLSYDGKNIESTIAGVNKKLGAKYFTEHGFDAFTNEATIVDSGKITARYNDDPPHWINVNGVDILTASNIALTNTPFTIHIKHDYTNFIDYVKRSMYKYYK